MSAQWKAAEVAGQLLMALVEECGLHLTGNREPLKHSKLGNNTWASSEFQSIYSVFAPLALWAPPIRVSRSRTWVIQLVLRKYLTA